MGGYCRGLIAPKSEVEKLIDGIESGEINRLKSMNACFAAMHDNYYTYEWTWAYHKIQEFLWLESRNHYSKRYHRPSFAPGVKRW